VINVQQAKNNVLIDKLFSGINAMLFAFYVIATAALEIVQRVSAY
jgi:hypothetical protein